MEKSIIRAKLQVCRPDIYIEVEAGDVRLLEFLKAHRVFAHSMRAKDEFKRELERRLSEQRA
jgi:predicted acylesterase/phospholipase RssA